MPVNHKLGFVFKVKFNQNLSSPKPRPPMGSQSFLSSAANAAAAAAAAEG